MSYSLILSWKMWSQYAASRFNLISFSRENICMSFPNALGHGWGHT